MCCILYCDVLLHWCIDCIALYCCIAIQGARDEASALYCPIQQVFTLYCCRARCIGFMLYWRQPRHMSSLGALPEELQGCCALALDTSSAGRFGQVNKACKTLVEGRLAGEKAARDRAVLEKVTSRWCEALSATWRVADGPSLISFCDGGAKIYKCSCTPDWELRVGFAYFNLASHCASLKHWKHWRLVAHGEAQPAEAAWQAFAASNPYSGRFA